MKELDTILKNRGFRKFHSGTNRIVYAYLEDTSFLIKVALDKVGMRDNPDEMKSSYKLKPFLPKVFEVSPCGTVATVERVDAPGTTALKAAPVATSTFEILAVSVTHINPNDAGGAAISWKAEGKLI